MTERRDLSDGRNIIFAEKSLERSGIEEIAKKANGPESLIYYRLKNKD